MKTFALILRESAQYHFQGQEASPRVRLKGTIVADASLENAAFYIAHRMADLYFGSRPRNVEWLSAKIKIESKSLKKHRQHSQPNLKIK